MSAVVPREPATQMAEPFVGASEVEERRAATERRDYGPLLRLVRRVCVRQERGLQVRSSMFRFLFRIDQGCWCRVSTSVLFRFLLRFVSLYAENRDFWPRLV